MMVLAFMISSIALVIMLPKPLPSPPDVVQPGPGVTHVEAVALNSQRLERYRQLEIVYANAAAAELFDTSLRAMTGRSLADLWGGESVAQSLLSRVRDEGIAISEDALLVQRPDGHARRVTFDAASSR